MTSDLTKEELEEIQKLREELGDDAKFVELGDGAQWHPPDSQCSYCQHHPSAADFQSCPHKVPGWGGWLRAPRELMNWKKRCPDHVTKPGFEKEDEALFKEHFPDEELPPQE